jgi:P27 family predicted phage terminase small subunit
MGERGPIGNPHNRRAQDRERKLRLVKLKAHKASTKPKSIIIRIPKELKGNPEAVQFWKEHARLMTALGRLEPEFRAQFIRLCLLYGRIQDYSRRIEAEGSVITGPRGGISKHPLLLPLRQAEEQFNQLAASFGLDPKSAQRLPEPKLNPLSRREMLLQSYIEK